MSGPSHNIIFKLRLLWSLGLQGGFRRRNFSRQPFGIHEYRNVRRNTLVNYNNVGGNEMLEFLQSIWNWEIAPIPICTTLLLYFVPIYWRKYRSDVYTPLYFSVYPLAKLNVPLSRYLGQSFIDDYIDDSYAEREKKIIKIKSVFSSILYVVIVPFMLSFVWSFILTREQFHLSTIAVLVSVIVRFSQSIINFSRYTMVSRRGLLSFSMRALLLFSFIFF